MKFIDTELMGKYIHGKANEEESRKVQMWLMLNLKSGSCDREFEELMDRVPSIKDEIRKERILSNLKAAVAMDRRQKSYMVRRKRQGIFIGAMFASLCIALAIMTFSFVNIYNETGKVVAWTTVTAGYGEVKELVLPDGSHMWLHNDTKVVYPDSFHGRHRQVFVSGEIYAEIESDKKNPFIVSADNVNVIVTGTRFNMRSYPDVNNVELSLIDGNVDMEYVTAWGKETMDIRPGETVAVNLKDGGVNKFEFEEYVSWKDRRAMYFNDRTLAEIALELEREFSVDIVISDELLASTRHFASFVNDESVMDILNILCGDQETEIIMKDTNIYINRK